MSTAQPQQPYEVHINGYLYDVREFRHPGGSIIKFLSGTGDATEAFGEFHGRSAKAQKMLASLPSRRAPPVMYPTIEAEREASRHAALSRDFAALRKKLLAEGWFDRSVSHATYRVLEILVLAAAGFALVASGLGLPAVVFGLLLLGIASGRCGWLQHEAGHTSFSPASVSFEIRCQELLFGLGCGMSGGWWRSQHNRHHATPQKLKHDVDLETLPFLAFNEAILGGKGAKNPFVRAWIPLQAYLFAPVTCLLVTLSWQFVLHPRYMYRMKKYLEMFWIALRFALLFAFKTYVGASWGRFWAGYLLAYLLGGSYIFVNFALSHTHLDVVAADQHPHWVEYSAKYTVNIAPSWAVDWWMGYLNFQIEHHLFPSMPQYRFARLAPQIKALFERHGLAYDVRSYFGAMADTFGNLNRVGDAFARMDKLR